MTKMKEKQLKELKSQLEEKSRAITLKETEFLEIEKRAEEKFKNSIKGFVTHPKYENLKKYLKVTTNSDSKINCLIIVGNQGLGKSSVIISLMKEMDLDTYYCNSYSTPLAFYKEIYHNRFKHFILDDISGLMEDEKGVSILRALTNTQKIRYVKYQSTSGKLDVPSNFIFEGSVTILTNKLTENMSEALLGRAVYRELNFTNEEILELGTKIIKFNYPTLKPKKLKEIVEFIRNRVNETTKNLSFRTFLKITEYSLRFKEWKELALEELETDEELVLVKEIEKLPVVERNRKWLENTGKTIRTLQRKIKELKKRQNDNPTIMEGRKILPVKLCS